MNPIVALLNQQNPLMDMMRVLYSAAQGSGNVMETLSQLSARDERIKRVYDTINQNGGIERAVYAESQKYNINPNDVLNQAKQMIQSINMK